MSHACEGVCCPGCADEHFAALEQQADKEYGDELTRLRAENAKLRAVVDAAMDLSAELPPPGRCILARVDDAHAKMLAALDAWKGEGNGSR